MTLLPFFVQRTTNLCSTVDLSWEFCHKCEGSRRRLCLVCRLSFEYKMHQENHDFEVDDESVARKRSQC